MNKLFGVTLIAALIAAPAAVQAQDAPPARDQLMRRPAVGLILEHSAELGLSADQVARIEAIGERLMTQNAPLLEQIRASGVPLNRSGEHRGARAARTPEQRARVQERMRDVSPERRARMEERMREMTPERRARMEERMREVTPERRARMQERMREMTPERRAEMQERMQEMTPERRGRMQERMQEISPERRARMQALAPVLEQLRTSQRAARQEIQEVLTAEQRARLHELSRERRSGAVERMRRSAAPRSSR